MVNSALTTHQTQAPTPPGRTRRSTPNEHPWLDTRRGRASSDTAFSRRFLLGGLESHHRDGALRWFSRSRLWCRLLLDRCWLEW
jgi:hypothetical protein